MTSGTPQTDSNPLPGQAMDKQSPPTSGIFLSVVIPAYNELTRLPKSLRTVIEYLESKGTPYEVLVVDDGSSDDTAALAEQFAQATPLRPAFHPPYHTKPPPRQGLRCAHRYAGRPGQLHPLFRRRFLGPHRGSGEAAAVSGGQVRHSHRLARGQRLRPLRRAILPPPDGPCLQYFRAPGGPAPVQRHPVRLQGIPQRSRRHPFSAASTSTATTAPTYRARWSQASTWKCSTWRSNGATR